LLDCGANQTINQNNIYANHIRWFFDTGLPEMMADRVRHIRIIARRAVLEATGANSGPVHLNFPFRKPFEPDAYTDQIDERLIAIGDDERPLPPDIQKPVPSPGVIDSVAALLEANKRGMFVVGPGDYGSDFPPALSRLSKIVSYPFWQTVPRNSDSASMTNRRSFRIMMRTSRRKSLPTDTHPI
jgi:2-succinyl-5-enolpyruvyl-6-hydroxy-3-cyclohexene-1-carboxylate synthase